VLIDEPIDVHRIEMVARRIGESGDVPRRDRAAYPLDVSPTLVGIAGVALAPCDAPQPPATRAGQRLHYRIADAEKSAPRRARRRHRFVHGEPLTHLRERDDGEVDHCVRGEEIKMGHRVVRAGDQPVDLVRLRAEKLFIAGQLIDARQSRAARAACAAEGLEAERESLDGAETPGDPGREQWIDKRVRVRQ
jgi:hypothetical protein